MLGRLIEEGRSHPVQLPDVLHRGGQQVRAGAGHPHRRVARRRQRRCRARPAARRRPAVIFTRRAPAFASATGTRRPGSSRYRCTDHEGRAAGDVHCVGLAGTLLNWRARRADRDRRRRRPGRAAAASRRSAIGGTVDGMRSSASFSPTAASISPWPPTGVSCFPETQPAGASSKVQVADAAGARPTRCARFGGASRRDVLRRATSPTSPSTAWHRACRRPRPTFGSSGRVSTPLRQAQRPRRADDDPAVSTRIVTAGWPHRCAPAPTSR